MEEEGKIRGMAGVGGGGESASSKQHIKFDKDDKGDAKSTTHQQPKKKQSRRNKRKRQNSTATAATASSKEDISSTTTTSCEKKLFNGLTLAISINQNNNMQTTDGDVSIMSTNQKSLKQTLKLHGATISPQIHKRVHYLVCSNTAIQNITRPVRQAYKRNVDIVNVDWVNACITMNTRVNVDDYICNDLVGKLIDEKEKEKNQRSESGIDDVHNNDALPDEETTGWSTPIQLDCCCVCHENGDFKCPWCTGGEQSCNLTLARLAKKQKK